MSTQQDKEKLELLQGTLDLLILRTLIFGPRHGQGIARAIQETSDEELLVEHGALYPALQRNEDGFRQSGELLQITARLVSIR
jgi:PadR family transcriptional regulator, regulatory protein PadR